MNDEMTFSFPTDDAAGEFLEGLAECSATLSGRTVRVYAFESQDANGIRNQARKLSGREVQS